MSLRIILVTVEEPFYLPRVIKRIVDGRRGEIITSIVLPPHPPSGSWIQTIRRQMMLLGTVTFILTGIRFVLRKLADRVGVPMCSVSSVLRRADIPIFRPQRINATETLDHLRSLEPDIIVSVSASQIFKRELLDLPRLGCVNVHSGLLPKYRGVLPSFWVLFNDESETGVTVHYMDEKADNGDIIVQHKVPIAKNDTQHDVLLKTKSAGAAAVLKALDLIECGDVRRLENDATHATYYSFPTPADIKMFYSRGHRFR